ncbi:MAG: 5'-deoxynucleotidase [Clostridiales bacterium]|nr:5'-deoxynucleotidase [Clostridiales bacterium]
MTDYPGPEEGRVSDSPVFPFFAMLDRMQYINRWGLMRNNRTENIKEHSMDVAIVAHALATIRNTVFADSRSKVDSLLVIGIALYHDASEIVTGDLPTPIKYRNPEIMTAYKKLESQAAEQLICLLPEEMRNEYRALFDPDLSDPGESDAYHLVKAADRICAYIKCISEEKSGNSEFVSAKQSILDSINKLNIPEVEFFMERFIPAYGMTLDQISE